MHEAHALPMPSQPLGKTDMDALQLDPRVFVLSQWNLASKE